MKGISVIVIVLSAVWIMYAAIARREYVASIRKRLESRRLDLGSLELAGTDASTIQVLESAASGGNARQAAYALTLLAEAPNYDIRPILTSLALSPLEEVRQRVYGIAADKRFEGILDKAEVQLRAGPVSAQVVRYLLTVSPVRERLAGELLRHDDPAVVESALEALRPDDAAAATLIGLEWIEGMARSEDPRRRAPAATAISIRGDQGPELLHRLFEDGDATVARAALRSAGALRSRVYLFEVIRALDRARLRADAIRALTAFGPSNIGTLSDILNDESVPIRVRRQIPRVLNNLPDQRSVNALLPWIGHPDLTIRSAVLKALNRLRETAPQLNFDDTLVMKQL